MAVISIALLFTLALLGEEPKATRRLAAHGESLRALEATLEAMRAGQITPVDGAVIELDDWLRPQVPVAEDLRIHVDVVPLSPPQLIEVRLRARYNVRGRWFERSIETRIWQLS